MPRFLSLLMTLFCATSALWAAFTPAFFTVSEGKQVTFSQGNLQYTQSSSTWSFAENQYDMLGESNLSGSSLADKIDLFGWSGSTGTAKWGIGTYQNNDYYKGDFVDWGQNTIGSYASDDYRTLTNAEWLYLLNTRTNAESKKGVARIQISDTEYANGLILLPDSWTCPKDVTFKNGFATTSGAQYYADYQTFTLTEWQKLEAAGAVFLPASGTRQGDVSGVQFSALYWSATKYNSYEAYYLYFNATKAITTENIRYRGNAVRLVQDTKYTISIAQPKHGTIAANKEACAEGRTVTLTLSPDAYYATKTVTVLQGETAIATTAVAGTTYQYTFTMPAGEVTITAEFEKLSSAFTPVAFTVSESGKQVYFSQGNLQCTGVTSGNYTWSFADYQTDMLGTDNVSGGTEAYGKVYGYSKTGTALTDKIDLFGWSGDAGSAKWGISTSQDNLDYAGNFVDWGQNTIGSYAPDDYRTLTKDEWDYLLDSRTGADEKKGVARINLTNDGSQYVNGLILLPDNCSTDITFNKGYASTYSVDAYAEHNTYTIAQWQQLEAVGAVFLPVEGRRHGTEVSSVQIGALYWSATPKGSYNAYYMYFDSNSKNGTYENIRYRGNAVRLVQDTKYAISLSQPQHGNIAADKTEAPAGETITLTITPDTGYELEAITVKDATNQDITVTDNKFTMPASAVTITATFKLQTFTITTYAENGTVTGAGTYDYDTEVELKAEPAEHYHFVKWSDDVTDNPRKVTVTENATYTAEFAIDQHTITVTAENGTVKGAGTYDYGKEVELKAEPATHYHFVKWSDDVTDNPRKVTVTENATYTAEFAIDQHTITVTAENGTVTGGGVYDSGSEVELTATPNEGYAFSQWSDGTTTNPYSFVITQDITIEAKFVPTTPTDIDTAEGTAGITVRKVLIDGEVYILRGEKVYTLTGVEVEELGIRN